MLCRIHIRTFLCYPVCAPRVTMYVCVYCQPLIPQVCVPLPAYGSKCQVMHKVIRTYVHVLVHCTYILMYVHTYVCKSTNSISVVVVLFNQTYYVRTLYWYYHLHMFKTMLKHRNACSQVYICMCTNVLMMYVPYCIYIPTYVHPYVYVHTLLYVHTYVPTYVCNSCTPLLVGTWEMY